MEKFSDTAQHIEMNYAQNSRKCPIKVRQTTFRIFQNSQRNLVTHFHKTVYISWFHDTGLWEWLGVGPYNFRRGCFSYVPEPNYTNFQQKISMKSFKNDFLNFCEIVPFWILVPGYMTGWIFISQIFNDNSQNLAYFTRPKMFQSQKLHNSNYRKPTIKECTVFWKPR